VIAASFSTRNIREEGEVNEGETRFLIVLTTALAAAVVVLTPTTAAALPPGEVAYAGTRVVINNCDFRREAFEVDDDGRLLHQWELLPAATTGHRSSRWAAAAD
jgi:hypothetical protein